MRVNLINRKRKKTDSIKLKFIRLKNGIDNLNEDQIKNAYAILSAGFSFIEQIKLLIQKLY